ncbi:MAG: hypothetical protein AAGC74_13550 [Verrucomicrobiota bacterium]
MKVALAIIALLGLIATGGVGYWAWTKWTKVEETGVALGLQKTIPAEQQEQFLELHNEMIDQDHVLRPLVEKHALMGYYEVTEVDAAIESLRNDTRIKFPNERNIWLVYRGKRSDRTLRNNVVRDLAKSFLEEVSSKAPSAQMP